jgi:nicotinate-nucleotide pyrophosphorylase (carboxylating)
MLSNFLIDDIIINALKEDIGIGDMTTKATIPLEKTTGGEFIAKEDGVLCGITVARRVFALLNPDIKMKILVNDAETFKKGDIIAEISGPARDILSGERVSLNLLQRLSGIATRTRQCVEAVEGTKATISDTRKTTPGLRVLEKYAVRVGGGRNHRYNLSDGVLIKDNHIRAAGGIRRAVEAARKNITHTLKIEVEVENLEMVDEALACGADIIMLDNMSLSEMKEAVRRIDGRALVEASGNMGDKDLRAVAEIGIDIISVGALTHTIRAADISLRLRDR